MHKISQVMGTGKGNKNSSYNAQDGKLNNGRVQPSITADLPQSRDWQIKRYEMKNRAKKEKRMVQYQTEIH